MNSQLLKFFFAASLLLVAIVIYLSSTSSPILWIAPAFFILFCIVNFSNTPPISLFFLYLIPFAIAPYHFFIRNLNISYWDNFQTSEFLNQVILCNLIFLFFLVIPLLKIKRGDAPSSLSLIKTSQIAFATSFLFCILILIYGIRGDSVLTTVYGQGDVQKSALHEYFLIPFLGLMISRNHDSKMQNCIILLILLAYILKTVLYGGRIEVVQIGLLYAYLAFSFFKDTPTYKLHIYVFSGFLAFTALGLWRSHALENVTGLSLAGFFEQVFFNDQEAAQGYISTNAGDIYHASMRMLGLIETGYLNISMRIESFLFFLFGVAVPSGLNPDHAILSQYMKDKYSVGGGGLIGTYFYVWLGWLGPVVAGLFAGYSIRYLYYGNSFYIKIYSILILVSFPRWYSYSPINFTKFCLVGMLFVIAIYTINACIIKLTKIGKANT